MKAVSNDFKSAIKQMGRQIDAKVTYTLNNEEIELGANELNSVTPHYEGGILKSVMKQLDLDSNADIPVGTILEAQFGVLVGNQYEYLSLGQYVVFSSEKQEDLGSYRIVCYDKMLYSMKDYETFATYPITIRNYIDALCDHIGLVFANESEIFPNYDKTIPSELYLDASGGSLNYTFRDVLDQLAQVTASTICINDDGELELRYITDTEEEIDEESLKDINVNFGESYGPINTIVFSRSADADKIHYPTILPANPIEIKISDNQILNGDDRADYFADIYGVLNGLEYYTNDFTSTGITYLDLCDRYDVKIGSNTYSCVMLNDDIQITQGLVENIHTDLPETSVTDYNTTTQDDRTQNRTTLIVDKVNGEIRALTTKTEQLEESIEVLRADLDTNVAIVSVDSSNKPFASKTYEINYSVKYLGEPLLTGYSVSTSDSHTGITTDFTTLGTLKFIVSNATAITTADNKYTITFSYTNSGTTFTSIRTVMISTLESESEQNVIISITEPEDKSVLWYNQTDNTLKKYNPEITIYELTEDTTFAEDKSYYELVNDEYLLIDYDSTTHKYTLDDGTVYSVGDTIPSNKIYVQETSGGDWSEVNNNSDDILRVENMITGEDGLNSKYTSLEDRIKDAETDLTNKVDSATYQDKITEIERKQTNTYIKDEIRDIVTGVGVGGLTVTAVKSFSATFDMNGMHYQKSTNDTISTINEQGLRVDDKSNNELFFAGVREGTSTSIVQTSNLNSSTYVIFGNNKGRLQEFTDPDTQLTGVGLFLL